jgi:hypothetical protein
MPNPPRRTVLRQVRRVLLPPSPHQPDNSVRFLSLLRLLLFSFFQGYDVNHKSERKNERLQNSPCSPRCTVLHQARKVLSSSSSRPNLMILLIPFFLQLGSIDNVNQAKIDRLRNSSDPPRCTVLHQVRQIPSPANIILDLCRLRRLFLPRPEWLLTSVIPLVVKLGRPPSGIREACCSVPIRNIGQPSGVDVHEVKVQNLRIRSCPTGVIYVEWASVKGGKAKTSSR